MTDAKKSESVREIDDAEVSFFRDNGWVKLNGLVSQPMATAMLKTSRAHFAATTATVQDEKGKVSDIGVWTEWRFPVRAAHEEPFSSVALSKVMGRNVQRLLGRDKSIRIWHDIVACKKPLAQQNGSINTAWHQDLPNWSIDRPGLTMWIALDHVAPEQGLVRYLSGSFREGPLGRMPTRCNAQGIIPDLLECYSELLTRHQCSPLFHLQPGDVVCHHSLVVHGAEGNRSERERWSYIVAYFPGDALYTGAPNQDSDGLGLKLGEPFEHPDFPQAYP